jgi:putative membrane protein
MTFHRVGALGTIAAAAILWTTLPAGAAEPASASKFVNEAASGGLMEVELGRYAASHAASDRVKEFGQRMVDDHSKANAELKETATHASITVPTTMNAQDRVEVSRLTRLDGAQFDRAYMKAMVEDHEKDVAAFREQSRSQQDGEVKSFAAKTLPTLEAHLKMAREVAAETGASSSATSGARPSER